MTRSGGSHALWDWPVRLTHWLLVVLLPLAWWTSEEGEMEWHARVGYTILVLVVARLIWGLLGSRHARFTDFLAGPRAIINYLSTGGSPTPGHNPLGAWSVIALLGLLLVQATSGLFNTDDILFNGPFYYAASSDVRNFLGEVHVWAFDALLVFVALHISAIAYYQLVKREALIRAMIAGSANGKTGVESPKPLWWAVLIWTALGLLLWWGISQAPKPPPLW
ncbi:MAG: cytochrome b/b6 domain-containing protein [Halieaceae bacterium]|nr:cytochrome b/b6 domain-containing protein [Halieaceae bacterium]